MSTRLPLPTLLSHAVVAFTIEFDNEFEHRMPHRTTRGSAGDAPSGPWLVSLVRESLERVVASAGSRSRLFEGMEPYPDGWRAAVRAPDVLPHHPMVLHRGGYPDGS